MMLLQECMKHKECQSAVEEIARSVMTPKNMKNHYNELIEKCLMNLPPSVLDSLTYEEDGTVSELSIRQKYVSSHPELSEGEKSSIMDKCGKHLRA